MQLYRICPEQYLESFSGMGSSYRYGGRWNAPGVPVLYFALSPATALLEMGHYLPSPEQVLDSYRLGVYQIQGEAEFEHLDVTALPDDWCQYPYPDSTQAIGSKILKKRAVLGFTVPSCAVPLNIEKSLIVNPLHPDLSKLELIEATALLYNDRLFTGTRSS